MASQISVRRTGAVVFASRILSVFTGLAFLLMIVRTLSTQQFGLWEVILDIVTFASYPAGVLVFWATREIARGRMLGRTAIWSNLGLSLAGVGLYFLFSVFVTKSLGGAFTTLALAALLVPITYWNQAANAVVSGYRPIAAGYSVIFSEASKLIVAFPLLIVLKVGIDGVVLSILVATVAQAATSTALTRGASALPFDRSSARRWASQAWLPSLSTLPYVLGVADTFLASVASGGTVLVGYYQAAFSVAAIAGYSLYLAAALYPLLLRGESHSVAARSIDLALLFGIPMAAGAASLARPILQLLKPSGVYLEASTALMILAVAALVNAVSLVLDQTLMGKESVDTDEKAGFARYLHSNLFFVSIVDVATALSYLAAIFIVVYLGTRGSAAVPTILDEWAAAQLAVFAFFAGLKALRARRGGELIVVRSVANYLIGAALMTAVLVLASSRLDYRLGSLSFGAELAAIGAAGSAAYLLYVYASEEEVRSLVRAFLKPILS